MDLFEAFAIKKGDIVALVGAGGKTALMFALAREAAKRGERVLITTTTRIYHPGEVTGWPVVLAADPGVLKESVKALAHAAIVVAGAGVDEHNKLMGVSPEVADELAVIGGFDLLLAEADGSAGRPFKGPRDGEPVIPAGSTLVIPVVGVDCLGKSIDSGSVHRPEVVAELMGVASGETVTPEIVAGVLLHSRGYRKNIPAGCRWVPFISKVRDAHELRQAGKIASLLGLGGARRVVMGAALETVPVREVALV
jgi:probable selenium-dependent hydroxylase accessory protein YqeC